MAKFKRYTYNGKTVQATGRRPSSRDDKKYERTVLVDGKERLVHYGDPNLPMQRDSPERRANFLSRHSCSTKTDPTKPGFWACYDWANTDEKSLDMDNENETLVIYGDAVKDLGNGRVGGYLVLFGDENNTDLKGDYFTKSTDFGSHKTTATIYAHGQDKKLGRRILDPQSALSIKDAGVWVEAQLSLRDEYEKAIYQMVKSGKLGWSSGTASHLVEREQKENGASLITRWPLGLDASLTPNPTEYRTQALSLKSLQFDPIEIDHQEGGEPSANETTVNVNINVTANTPEQNPKTETTKEVNKMTEQKPVVEVAAGDEAVKAAKVEAATPAPEYATKDELKNMSGGIDNLSAQLNAIMEKLEKSGPMKDVGYIAPDDEASKPEVKSFADYLLAIYRGNSRRLNTVYKSTKDLSGEVGGSGGYLVPQEYEESLLQVANMPSSILNRVRSVPVNRLSGSWPALDQYIVPTAGSGQTAMGAGVTSTTTAAGANYTETEPGFELIQWRVTKQGGYTEVENELIEDSPFAIESLLTGLYNLTVNAKKEQLVLRGTGAGEPLGILNAGCAVSVTVDTDNTFAYTDALEMVSRFKMVSSQTPVWIIHPSIWPDIGVFETSAGGGVFQANQQSAIGQNLLGYPILQSEHLPQANNAGCVVLADLQAYLMFERRGVSIAFSEHAAFTNGKGTWRFDTRFDGQPWLKSAITLADPQGSYTVSPFVYLND